MTSRQMGEGDGTLRPMGDTARERLVPGDMGDSARGSGGFSPQIEDPVGDEPAIDENPPMSLEQRAVTAGSIAERIIRQLRPTVAEITKQIIASPEFEVALKPYLLGSGCTEKEAEAVIALYRESGLPSASLNTSLDTADSAVARLQQQQGHGTISAAQMR